MPKHLVSVSIHRGTVRIEYIKDIHEISGYDQKAIETLGLNDNYSKPPI